jgi:o-succinylbenzoate synthase
MKLTCRMRSVQGGLSEAAVDARRRWRERCVLLLQLDDDDGHVGQGEAAPLPGYSIDTLEQARASLRALPWERFELRGDEPLRLELGRVLDGIDPARPSARCAVEAALLDLVAQREGVPVHRLLGARAPSPVALAALLPISGGASGAPRDDVEIALAFAEAQARAGITHFKVKIGLDLEREIALLRRFRREGGARYALRLDANGTLPELEAPRILEQLAELEPEYVEEPMPLRALFRLGKPSPVPVALDESLIARDAERLAARALDAGLVSALVLKPMALGGLLRCLRLAEVAARRGAGASVSHLYDGPFARAAYADLALALERPLPAGLAPHPGLGLWPELDSPAFRGGRIEPHDAPGLGLEPLPFRS